MYYLVITGLQTLDCHCMFRLWTAIDGPDGVSLLSVRFHGDDDQANFEALAGVEPLPTSGTITPEHAATLAAMDLPATPSSTLADVRAMAKAHCPGML